MIKQTTTLSCVLFGLISLTACQSTDSAIVSSSDTVRVNTPSQTTYPHQRIITSPASIPTSQAHTHLHKPYTMPNPAIKMVVGEYINSRYDWIQLTITAIDNQHINIAIQSHDEIKHTVCNYQGQAHFIGQDSVHGALFETITNESPTFFQFKNHVLTIDTQDRSSLHLFCSDGTTLIGNYTKIA
ncbi:hypothetical protein [Psychrobacter sp. I-STPA6b]|uniref:hypothetical protein n=1 Tax=Psychrobacter sp. I-STPA6b TaxID=2585718 RepID=UPI001D0C5CB7|nr:hypothetical protein [Psychrobacter sp. I-STPA6b]